MAATLTIVSPTGISVVTAGATVTVFFNATGNTVAPVAQLQPFAGGSTPLAAPAATGGGNFTVSATLTSPATAYNVTITLPEPTGAISRSAYYHTTP